MSWKKMITGEPMPDKNDPRYKERYEREVEAGRKFAEKSGFTWLVMKIQKWANSHRMAFLAISFGIVIGFFVLNIIGLVRNYSHSMNQKGSSVEQVDSAMNYQRIHYKNR